MRVELRNRHRRYFLDLFSVFDFYAMFNSPNVVIIVGIGV